MVGVAAPLNPIRNGRSHPLSGEASIKEAHALHALTFVVLSLAQVDLARPKTTKALADARASLIGRVGGIRTHDLQHPMLARYLATLQPDWGRKYKKNFKSGLIKMIRKSGIKTSQHNGKQSFLFPPLDCRICHPKVGEIGVTFV